MEKEVDQKEGEEGVEILTTNKNEQGCKNES
jgi:hypothetical protein